MAELNSSIKINKEAVLKTTEGIIEIMYTIYGRGFNMGDDKPATFFSEMFDVAIRALISESN